VRMAVLWLICGPRDATLPAAGGPLHRPRGNIV
jgi:hypothetical protein